MRMLGVFDPLYVRARAALLDAAEALAAHIEAVVLVGAQAIYLHTGAAELAVAEYTTDADFAISPLELAGSPLPVRMRSFARRTNAASRLTPKYCASRAATSSVSAAPSSRAAGQCCASQSSTAGRGSSRWPAKERARRSAAIWLASRYLESLVLEV